MKNIVLGLVLSIAIITSLSLGADSNISDPNDSFKGKDVPSLDALPALEFSGGPTRFPGEEFILNAKVKVSKDVPIVSEYTRSAAGDEHIILTGDKLTLSNTSDAELKVWNGEDLLTVKPAVTQNGIAVENHKAIYKLPSNFGQYKFGVLWFKNINGYSAPIKINATDVWWADDKVSQGTIASVYGRNLSFNNDTSIAFVYIKNVSSKKVIKCSVTSVNPYRIQYIVPASAKGTYELWVHNGTGGQYNWSKHSGNILVWSGMAWSENNYINVSGIKVNNPAAAKTNVIAINNAILAAHRAGNYKTVQLPSGIIYINSEIATGWKVRLRGTAGGSAKLNTLKTEIRTLAPFEGRLMTASGNEEFQLENIFFNVHNSYNGGHLFHLRGGRHLTFKNVRIFAKFDNNIPSPDLHKNIPIMDSHEKEYLTIEDCHLIGGQLDFVCGRHLRVCNTNFRMVNASVTCMYPWGAEKVSITNCDFRDYGTELQETGRGRIYTMSGLWSSNKYIYIAHNVGRDLGIHQDFGDKNQGEAIMSEGNACKFQGKPIAASINTVTFRMPIPSRTANAKYNTYHLTITKGKGVGQIVEVFFSKGNTYILKENWKVIPDSTSVITVNSGTHFLVVYDNDFTQKPYIAKAHYGIASAAVEPFGGCSHWIADKNKFTGFQNALFNFPTQHSIGQDPNFWMEWHNNYIDGKGGGQGYNSYLINDGSQPGPKVLAEMLRRNTIINVETAYSAQGDRSNSGYEAPVMEFVVAEHNIMAEPMKNIASPGKPKISTHLVHKQVLYNNQ